MLTISLLFVASQPTAWERFKTEASRNEWERLKKQSESEEERGRQLQAQIEDLKRQLALAKVSQGGGEIQGII